MKTSRQFASVAFHGLSKILLRISTLCGSRWLWRVVDSRHAPPVVVTPPDPVFGGIWAGVMTIDASLGSEECAALVTEDGRFRIFCAFNPLQLVGMQSNNSGAVIGSGLAISSLVFLDGSTVTNLSMEGTAPRKRQLHWHLDHRLTWRFRILRILL